MRIAKGRLPYFQFLRVAIHPLHEGIQGSYLLRIGVDERTAPVGKRQCCIVATRQHQAIKQVFNANHVSSD